MLGFKGACLEFTLGYNMEINYFRNNLNNFRNNLNNFINNLNNFRNNLNNFGNNLKNSRNKVNNVQGHWWVSGNTEVLKTIQEIIAIPPQDQGGFKFNSIALTSCWYEKFLLMSCILLIEYMYAVVIDTETCHFKQDSQRLAARLAQFLQI